METSPPAKWPTYAIVAFTVLAPALGGCTELWSQAVLALGTGVLLILSPPRKSLGLWPTAAFCALGGLAAIAFAPAAWFPRTEWQSAFGEIGISLPPSRTPQPWITLECEFLFLLGVVWSYYLFAVERSSALREKAWDIYGVTIVILAGALAISYALGEHVPFWPGTNEFGFFPNRNQTSNVLGLGAIMLYARGLQSLERGRRYWWIWIAALSLVLWALILNYSRAGIILLFLGALGWHVWWLITSTHRRNPAVTLGALGLMLAILLVAGGETLQRFGQETADFVLPARNARLTIYRDTLGLLKESSFAGIGFGNFPAIFALHRHYSVAANEIAHPESDWLWVAVELGALAPLLLLALFGWWMKRCLPLQVGTSRLMRCAALTAGYAFALHGIFDVSGHRIGAVWPALFLASTAVHPEASRRASRWIAPIFRLFGLFFIAAGVWWFASIAGVRSFPTSVTFRRISEQIESALDLHEYEKLVPLAARGLRIAPLDWSLYYDRAVAETALHQSGAARHDFAIARLLLPHWPDLCLQEGKVWLEVRETDFAFEAWEEALRRSPDAAAGLYAEVFNFIKSDVALVDRWRELGRGRKDCLLFFLRSAGKLEVDLELQRLLAENPTLEGFTPAELKMLFYSWYENGDRFWLAQILREHPAWQTVAWREMSLLLANEKNYREAYEMMLRYSAAPAMLSVESRASVDVLRLRFKIDPSNLDNGLALFLVQIREREIDAALSTAQALGSLAGRPAWIFYQEAKLWAEKEEWEKAWNALGKFQ